VFPSTGTLLRGLPREKKGKKFFVAKAWVKMQEEWERRERMMRRKGFTN
jgi:hypothetical protein